MNSVIIFDVTGNLNLVIADMVRKGYFKNWMESNQVVNLPHNIVWRPNTESQQAINDLQQSVAQVNNSILTPCVLQRCVVLNSTPWRAIYGNP